MEIRTTIRYMRRECAKRQKRGWPKVVGVKLTMGSIVEIPISTV